MHLLYGVWAGMEVPRNILGRFVFGSLKWLAMVVLYSEVVASIVAYGGGGICAVGICDLYCFIYK